MARLSVVEQVGRLCANRGRPLAIQGLGTGINQGRATDLFSTRVSFGNTEFHLANPNIRLITPKGLEIVPSQSPIIIGQMQGKTPAEIDAFLAEIDNIQVAVQRPEIKISLPEILDVPGMKLGVMKGEVTVGLFRQFVESSGYEITGHNADELLAILKGKGDKKRCNYLSLLDGQVFAKWLSEKTGRKFRIPTDKEWLDIKEKVGGQLADNDWEWVDTKDGAYYFLRCLFSVDRFTFHPVHRYGSDAVRLVEDKE